MQDILGYESLTAGVWFLCIDFQMAVVYVAIVALGRTIVRGLARRGYHVTIDPGLVLGGALATASIWFFNLDESWDVWAVYFFGHFFMGVMVYYGLQSPRYRRWFALYALMLATALAFSWRGHLAISLVTGLALFFAGKYGLMERWPASRAICYQGRTSYSLFLLHFPVMVVVCALWARFELDGSGSVAAALILAYVASVLLAAGFHHAIEMPAARLARRFG